MLFDVPYKRTASSMAMDQRRIRAATAERVFLSGISSQKPRWSNVGVGTVRSSSVSTGRRSRSILTPPRRTTVDKLSGSQQSRLRRLQHNLIPDKYSPSHGAGGSSMEPSVSARAGNDADGSRGHWGNAMKEVSCHVMQLACSRWCVSFLQII